MKILVTGAAGMIGSHVVDYCIKNNFEVFSLDDMSRGKLENINPGSIFFKGSITDSDFLDHVANQIGRIDVIIHQASIINEGIDFENINTDIQVNIFGTINILKMAERCQAKRFIYASSVAVYGKPKKLPAIEDSSLPEPIASYGIGKMASEKYVKYYSERYNMSYACLRYSNIYGPRQGSLGEVGVISHFIDKIFKTRSINIYGTGDQERDFLFIEDCVNATMKSAFLKNNFTINIGKGIGTSINEIVRILKSESQLGFTIKNNPLKRGDIGVFWCDISEAKKILNWTPEVNIREGIVRTIHWLENIKK